MPNPNFVNDAVEAGFTRAQARFMDDYLAKHPHNHEIEDVEGLPETLSELGIDVEDTEEEEES